MTPELKLLVEHLVAAINAVPNDDPEWDGHPVFYDYLKRHVCGMILDGVDGLAGCPLCCS